jgi:outer membrane protein assembly factor BamC
MRPENLIIKTRCWKLILLGMTMPISGCAIYNLYDATASNASGLEYQTVVDRTPPLEVPPDLTGPDTEGRYIVPDLKPIESKTYSAYSKERADGEKGINTRLLPEKSDESMVRIERSGTQRWLVVKSEPEIVWPIIKDFWKEMGFGIKVEIPEAGVIETDWAENRAITPQNILLRKVSTIELDKFRTRLERGDGGTTEIFISHRRMEEQPSDPDLEAEMLAQLVMYFGVAKEQARSIVNSTKVKDRAYLNLENSGVLTLEEAFDRSWRRVGLALDRIGFTVEDRDRSAGIYFVRYVDPENKIIVEPGAWDKFNPFSENDEDDKPRPKEYRVLITGTESGSEVKVVNVDGSHQKSDIADRILNLLYEQLR